MNGKNKTIKKEKVMATKQKPISKSITDSNKLLLLEWRTKCFYMFQKLHSDNSSTIKASPYYLKGEVYPKDDSITIETIKKMTKECLDIGILIYYNIDGISYLHDPQAGKHEKLIGNMSKGEHPLPPITIIKQWEKKFNSVYTPITRHSNKVNTEYEQCMNGVHTEYEQCMNGVPPTGTGTDTDTDTDTICRDANLNTNINHSTTEENSKQGTCDCVALKTKKITTVNNYTAGITQIIDYLNTRLSSKFSTKAKTTVRVLTARLKEGYVLEDFYFVIDNKFIAWGKDPKMSNFLRPETLFGEKFDGYLNEVSLIPKKAKDNINGITAD